MCMSAGIVLRSGGSFVLMYIHMTSILFPCNNVLFFCVSCLDICCILLPDVGDSTEFFFFYSWFGVFLLLLLPLLAFLMHLSFNAVTSIRFPCNNVLFFCVSCLDICCILLSDVGDSTEFFFFLLGLVFFSCFFFLC